MLCECLFLPSGPSGSEVLRAQTEHTLCTPTHCLTLDLWTPAEADASAMAGLLLLAAAAALWRLVVRPPRAKE